jgi:two-component system, NtrC family, response regulator GlrR
MAGAKSVVHTLTRSTPKLGEVLRTELALAWTDEAGAHEAKVTDTVVLGSAEGAGIRVVDPTVSRVHAEIGWRDSGAWVRDLGSRNGTVVDGVRVDAALLAHGARLVVGGTTLEVRHAREPQRVVLWPEETFGPLRGASAPMRELFARLSRVARSEATALITGETGTGKELVARAIHEASARSKGPLVVVDCTAVPENLFESELFGHARGSFTGATSAREGAIESASGGTLFLDEIGELPASMQPKLLRALESKSVRRVGESHHRPVDVRFVAATHRNLAERVAEGSFREDLFFRLAVLVVDVPPLRSRPEDIPLLVEHFMPAGAPPLTPALVQWMASHAWRGNVRELRNFVERTVALGEADASRAALPPTQTSLPAPPLDRPFKEVQAEWMDHLEREYVRGWLARTDGNVTAAADAIGLSRTYFHRLVKKHDL